MSRKNILICGAFGFETMDTGGQPVKTRELYYGLREELEEERVVPLETVGWKNHPVKLFADFFRESRNAKIIIMLPAHNGLAVFSRLLVIAKKLFHCRIYYDVVGGWLPQKVSENEKLCRRLSRFDGVWVETTRMKNELEKCGLSNTIVVRNFKSLTPISMKEIKKRENSLFKFCAFSRVVKEKGIEDAVNAVEKLSGEFQIILDIYGPIDKGYEEEFENLQRLFPPNIHYKGVAFPYDSVRILKDYDALLFPTHYPTEGIPGTIVDAFSAGVPVIASRWDSYADVIDEGVTGIGYEMGNYQEFLECIRWACEHRDRLFQMRVNCIKKAKDFLPEKVLSEIIGGVLQD